MRLPRPPVLLITDRRQTDRPLEDVAAAAFAAGCRWLSLREKDLDPAERLALAGRLAALGRAHGATVTVHGDMAAARAADGVHLARDSDVGAARNTLGADALIGYSAHDLDEAAAAARAGADYVTLSPVFASASKPGYGPLLGLDGLARAAGRLDLPVIALGGVTAANAAACLAAGAAGVAVMGAVMAAPDPGRAMAALAAIFD